MATILVSRDDIAQDARDWRHVVNLMLDTERDFQGASVAVLPPNVQEAGTAFAQAWAIYAQEAAVDAGDIVTALEETLRDFDGTDGRRAEEFRNFLIGCGPETGPSVAIGCPGPSEGLVPGPSEPLPSGEVAMPSSLTSRLGDLP